MIPATVQEVVPEAIVQLGVPPPRAPLPAASVSATLVALGTVVGVPSAPCACTTTSKAIPAVGFAPPLMLVTASFGAAGQIVVGALLPGEMASPAVRVAVRTTPDSATE